MIILTFSDCVEVCTSDHTQVLATEAASFLCRNCENEQIHSEQVAV
jgi:predicted RNA-binding Zn-ribbon protein involved in translation (DUF1610 family)